MQDYQRNFIEFILRKNILRFGEFTLKSGRLSPYFFNAGEFKTGEDLSVLGQFYADAIMNAKLNFDILFGPAYKGIPLVCASSMALATAHQENKPFAFNRKEIKDHGEGGQIVGADIRGKNILLVDDVITAGTAIKESFELLSRYEARLVGVVISFNRQEKGAGVLSAIQEVEEKYQIPVISIASLDNLVEYLKKDSQYEKWMHALVDYRAAYGTM